MFMTVVEFHYVPRGPVTSEGICQAMMPLLAASRCLDDGDYFVIADALSHLGTDPDYRAATRECGEEAHQSEWFN